MIQELVDELERLLEAGQIPEALELFNGLHPMDPGEILEELPKSSDRSSWPSWTP